jgi:transcription elongation factor Elf1
MGNAIPMPPEFDSKFECPFCHKQARISHIWGGMGWVYNFLCWHCRRYGAQVRYDRQAAWDSFCAATPAKGDEL